MEKPPQFPRHGALCHLMPPIFGQVQQVASVQSDLERLDISEVIESWEQNSATAPRLHHSGELGEVNHHFCDTNIHKSYK